STSVPSAAHPCVRLSNQLVGRSTTMRCMKNPLHVLVAGGGIGGLCLAHGLRRAGVAVSVFERDRDQPDPLMAYRIDINPDGARALHECLPTERWDAFLAATGRPGAGMGFVTSGLGELLHLTPPPAAASDPLDGHHPIGRATL